MSSRVISVVDPAVNKPALTSLNLLSLLSPLPVQYHLPALFGYESFENQSKPAGIVILGSFASPNEEIEWQVKLKAKLLQWIEAKVPILAICYGHQLISSMFGGKVAFCAGGIKHSGYREVLLKADPRLNLTERTRRICCSHREEVTQPPAEFELWGEGGDVAIEALRHPTLPIWTIQTHPEASKAFCESRGIQVGGEQERRDGDEILRAFLNYCANQA